MKNTAKKVQTLFDLDPTTIICLYKISLKEKGSYLFHAGQNGYHKKIVFDGQQYDYFPIKTEGFEIQGDGRLPRPVLTFSNHRGVISLRLKEFNDFINHKVTRIKTFVKYLDNINFPDNVNPFAEPDPEASFDEDVFYVNRKTREDDNIVAFELVSPLELQNANIPARRIYANTCPWIYRGAIGCGYNGKPISDSKNKRFVPSGYYPRANMFGNMEDVSMVGSEVYFSSSSAGGRILEVRGGSDHSLLLLSNGDVYGFGGNNQGQLGLGDNINRSLPTLITGGVENISAGNRHSIFLVSDGTAYSCGNNNVGQLGLGDNTDRDLPTEVSGDIGNISAGGNYSLFLANNGSGYSCGNNSFGELGLGDNTNRDLPTKVSGDIGNISAGGDHSLFLANNGSGYSCGGNLFGQLGLGDNTNRDLPTKVSGDIGNISAGGGHSLFLADDGTAYSCGNNSDGALGLGGNTDRDLPTKVRGDIGNISAGGGHSLFLADDGTAYSCGNNSDGALGLGDNTDRDLPTKVRGDIGNISAGGNYSLFLASNEITYSCGNNNAGQLGLGGNVNRNLPAEVSGRVPEFAPRNLNSAYNEWAATGIYQAKDVVQITPFDHDSDLNPVDVYVCIRGNAQSNPVYNREDWVLDECSKSLCGCRLRFSNAATGAGGATRVIETRVSADEFWTEEEEGLPFGGFPGTDPYNFK